jgi:hypothetical protein
MEMQVNDTAQKRSRIHRDDIGFQQTWLDKGNERMFKRTLFILIVLLLSACGLRAVRGSEDLVTESGEVSGFDRVEVHGSGEVIITQDGTESLSVETDDNVMEYVTTEVRGRTLELGFEDAVLVSPTRLTFNVHLKELAGLDVSGSGDIEAESIETDRLEIKVSGSGDVQFDSLTAGDVEMRISGSGEVELAGEAAAQDITISGSGKYRAGDLESQDAEVKISGSGDATVWAAESLDVDISGSGSLTYYGRPSLNSSTSGSGEIRGRGEK